MHEKSQEVEQQVRAENLVLRAEILVLEQKLESSSGTSGQMTQSTGTPQPKRKRGDSATKTETRDRPVKKAKSTEAISVSQSNVVQPIVIRGNLDLDEHAIDLINCFQRISESKQAISNIANKHDTLQIIQADLAVRSTAEARRNILSIQTHTTQNAGPQSITRKTTIPIQEQHAAHTHAEIVNDADSKCKILIQLFPFLLRTLDTLYERSEASDLRDQVIYSIIYLFQSLLEHICNLSAFEGLQELATAASGEEIGKANGRLLAGTTDFLSAPLAASKSANEKTEDKVIKTLCKLAVTMMNDVDTLTLANQEIFDGFLFFLLLRIGNLLKVFIFGIESQDSVKDVHPKDMRASHEAQAPYLIFLLRHARSLASQRSKFSSNPQTMSSAGSYSQENRKFAGISRIANKRLQNTLLKGVFGEQADEFAEFEEVNLLRHRV